MNSQNSVLNFKVSIVTVCFNSENTIKDTIDSVLNQSYPFIEYIIVDGLSTDKTIEIVKSYKQKFLLKNYEYKWISEQDNGIYDAYNKGIKMSTGDIIGIINSDDWYESNAIRSMANAYDGESMIFGDMNICNHQKKYLYTLTCNGNLRCKVNSTMPINFPATFIPIKVYNKVGMFNTSYRLSGDYDFILRCFIGNEKFIYLPIVISNMRNSGATSFNKNLFTTAIEDFKIRSRHNINMATYFYFIKILIAFRIIMVRGCKHLLSKLFR